MSRFSTAEHEIHNAVNRIGSADQELLGGGWLNIFKRKNHEQINIHLEIACTSLSKAIDLLDEIARTKSDRRESLKLVSEMKGYADVLVATAVSLAHLNARLLGKINRQAYSMMEYRNDLSAYRSLETAVTMLRQTLYKSNPIYSRDIEDT